MTPIVCGTHLKEKDIVEPTEEIIKGTMAKLKNLPQYKNMGEEDLRQAALWKLKRSKYRTNLKKQELSRSDFDVEEQFSAPIEKELAKNLLGKYLKDYSLDNISDKNLLKQLIYLEVFQKCRLQKAAEDFQKENGSVPLQILDSIHKNLDKIIELKNSLGLTKEDSKADGYSAFTLLMKKAEIWRQNNQASREAHCPHCGQRILFKIRTGAWELLKHPFFKDRILGNEHIIKLYGEGKLTKEDLASIFGVSTDYADWLVERWKKLG